VSTEQLGLSLHGHLANLVEKQGSFMCRFEQSGAAPVRTSERSALMTEQFTFQ
jgi:hypothetical protein